MYVRIITIAGIGFLRGGELVSTPTSPPLCDARLGGSMGRESSSSRLSLSKFMKSSVSETGLKRDDDNPDSNSTLPRLDAESLFDMVFVMRRVGYLGY